MGIGDDQLVRTWDTVLQATGVSFQNIRIYDPVDCGAGIFQKNGTRNWYWNYELNENERCPQTTADWYRIEGVEDMIYKDSNSKNVHGIYDDPGFITR